jgi:hypothetical protein
VCGTICLNRTFQAAEAAEALASCPKHSKAGDLQVLLLIDGEPPLAHGELVSLRTLVLSTLRALDGTVQPSVTGQAQPHAFVSRVATVVKAREKGHIHGHRYCMTDTACAAALCQGTPLSKLTSATAASSQAALSALWLDCEHRRVAEPAIAASVYPDLHPAGDSVSQPAHRASGPAHGTGLSDTRDAAGSAAVSPQGPAIPVSTWPGKTDDAASVRMEVAAQTPQRRWVYGKWALGSELLHADETVARDIGSLPSAARNALGMASTYFPGSLGL